MNESSELEYVGFWLRLLASIVDTIAVMIVTAPFARVAYDGGFFGYGYGALLHGTEVVKSPVPWAGNRPVGV